MSKPSDDLSALFRSLRPDETTFHTSTGTVARDAEQRWPLFKAVAPQKSQATPPLSAQERQRWINQEKPEVGVRKPALSLPGLSDKMSKGLDRMSVRAVTNTAAVQSGARKEAENPVAERAVERPGNIWAALPPTASPTGNRASAARAFASESVGVVGEPGLGLFGKKAAGLAPVLAERQPPATGRVDDALKSMFNRLETKSEVVAKSAGNRSSFLDRLGKL